jgi:hypothetical protein
MRTLRMSWNTEKERLVYRWVESEAGEKGQADSPTRQHSASRPPAGFAAATVALSAAIPSLPNEDCKLA